MIVLAVLLLCGLAGRLEYRRRFGGAVVFAGVAVLGLIGVSAQPGIALPGYLPTVLGLLFGYLILRALLDRLRAWRAAPTRRSPGPTSLPDLDPGHRRRGDRRRGRRAAAGPGHVGGADRPGPARAAAGGRARAARTGRGRPGTARADPVRHQQRQLLPDRHRAAGPGDRPGRLVADHHRDGRQPLHPRLRHAGRQAAGRAPDHPDLRVQRGRGQPRGQRPLAGVPDPRPAGRGPAAAVARTWCCPPATTASPRVLRWTCSPTPTARRCWPSA